MNVFWQDFIKQYQSQHECMVEFDAQWPSPCLVDQDNITKALWVRWQPVSRHSDASANLKHLGTALEIQIPDTIECFYCAYYADHLSVNFDGRVMTLLQIWNEEDFARLQKNIIGHVLMKRRLKQPDTIFIGVTDDDEELISIIPSSGEVVFEYVGRTPHQVVANSMQEFIGYLTVA